MSQYMTARISTLYSEVRSRYQPTKHQDSNNLLDFSHLDLDFGGCLTDLS